MKRWLIVIICLCIIILSLGVIGNRVYPNLNQVAQKEMDEFVQLIINHSSINTKLDNKKAYQINYRNDQISSINFDMLYLNSVTSKYINDIENTLISIENGSYKASNNDSYNKVLNNISNSGGIVTKVKLGQLTNNIFLFNLGPSINIKYKLLSVISSNIEKKIKNYGINHLSISIYLHASIKLLILYPLNRRDFKHNYQIQLLFQIIEGEVPSWYQQ